VFVRKHSENNEIVRYKEHLVAQCFSQHHGIDYRETYSPVMDVITFLYLINLVVSEKLNMQFMDVVTTYFYGDLDTKIYMKVIEGLKLSNSNSLRPQNTLSTRLRCSLYGLKQSGWMWYNRLSKCLISQEYENNELCPCVFIKKSHFGFLWSLQYMSMTCISSGCWKSLRKLHHTWSQNSRRRILKKTLFYLGLELKHYADGILVHQSNYT